MPDFRVADTAPEHPKLRAVGLPAIGLWAAAGAYAMRELTDGWVPEYWVLTWPGAKRHAAALVGIGLWERKPNDHGMPGYQFHDWSDYQRSAEQLATERATLAARRALYSDSELVSLVKARDRDRCRYCGRGVSWKDRRGPGGATFDHVVPLGAKGGTNDPENVVVCCRSCNARKKDRTPAQAGMSLRDAPSAEPVGSSSGSSSGAGSNQNGSTPPYPGPSPVGGGSGGRGSSSTERAQDRNAPRPRCPEHAQLPADQRVPSCSACKQLRVEAEQQAADQAERAAAERAERRALIDDCPECDDSGMRDFGELGVGRCTHPDLARSAS